MRLFAILMLVAVALAGCSDDGAEERDPTRTVTPSPTTTSDAPNVQENGSAPASQPVQRFNETHEVRFSQANLANRSTVGSNCVIIEGDAPFELLLASGTATWTPAGANGALVLRLVFNATDERVSGNSPLELTVENLGAGGEDDRIYFLMEAAENNVVVEQSVTLALTLDYVSDAALSASVASCAITG